MSLENFIAKRITFSKENKKTISNSVLRIAISAVAIGIAVMIITISVVVGFKNEIYKKIIGFQSHITIQNRDLNTTFESLPISKNQSFYKALSENKNIRNIQTYITKPAIIKSKDEIQGIILKGADTDYDWGFFKNNLIEGTVFSIEEKKKSNKIVISEYISNLLNLKINDKLIVYFIQKKPRVKVFYISGIYNTGMEEFDKLFGVCDIKMLQSVNLWSSDKVSGFEIHVKDFNKIDETSDYVKSYMSSFISDDGSMYEVKTFKENNPEIVDWLQLSDMNVTVIISMMIIVAILNMISGLLIIILEKTNMIGVLKTLGAENSTIRKIFITKGAFLIGKGMIFGNVIGISLLLIQKYTHLIPLDPATYYVSAVPVEFNILNIILLNLGTLIVTIFSLVFPAMLISKISPVKAIKFN